MFSEVLIGFWVKEHQETKRATDGFAYNLAKEDWSRAVDMADKRGGSVYPLESFIISIKTLMGLTEKGKSNDSQIKEILNEHRRVMSVVKEHYDSK